MNKSLNDLSLINCIGWGGIKLEISKVYKAYSLKECLDLKEKHLDEAEYIAGGTDLLVHIREKENKCPVIIDISDVKELKGIDANNEIVKLGAMTTFSEVVDSDWIKQNLQGLWEACKSVGSPQIRNTGTVGGNIANGSPAADSAPILFALGSEIQLDSNSGTRTVSIEDFYLGKGKTDVKSDEILKSISFKKPSGRYGVSFEKLGLRNALAISRISTAIFLVAGESGAIQEVRVASGSIGLVPQREKEMEEFLLGKTLDGNWKEEALELFSKIVENRLNGRSTMPFKKEAIKGVFENALTKALNQLG